MKIFSLTYNELVKQFKKPSINIILVLILLSAIILPIGASKISTEKYAKYSLENNKYLLDDAEIYLESIKEDKTQKGLIEYEYALIDRDYRKLFLDNEIGYDDWKGREADEYKYAAYGLAAIEFVLEGYNKDIVFEKARSIDPNLLSSYYDMTLAKKKEIQAQYKAEMELYKSYIINNDYTGHTREEINRKNNSIATLQNDIAEYEKLKAKNPKDEEGKAKLLELEKKAKDAPKRITELEQERAVIQFRLDNDINYDLNNWKNNAIVTVEKEMREARYELMTEKEYTSSASMQGYSMDYDDYVVDFNKKKEAKINKIKEVWHGLENNIPSLEDVRDARSVLDSSYEIYIILAVIMVIIIGGGIVATEYSKGTIRLLLIRPVSRWKILLSKLLAVLIVGFAIVILGIGILYASTGYVFGFETYKVPLLETVNGVIVNVDYISYLMPKIIMSCASLLFIASLVFMISTVARNTALAVAISMVLYLGTAPLTQVLISMKQTWLVSTFIPYINSSYLRLMPSTQEMLSNAFGLELQYRQGAIQLCMVSIVMLVVTFVIFMKKDVKN